MSVGFDPPSGTPLPGDGGTIPVCVTTTGGGVVVVVLVTPNGPIRLESVSIGAGKTKLRIVLPPGGAPAGSKLHVGVMENSGNSSVAVYPV